MSGSTRTTPPARGGTIVLALIAVLCVLSLEVRWFLCRELPFIMDELVDTQLAIDISRGATFYVDRPFERMPLMTLVLATLHDPADGSFESAVAARHVFWLLMLVTALGTVLVARRFGGWPTGIVALGLLLGFSSFLERSIRVRADALSTACSLPALIVLTAPRLRIPALVAAGFGLGLAWITTQKAVYFIAAFAVALVARHLYEARTGPDLETRSWRLRLLAARVGAAVGGFSVPFAGILLWAWLEGALRPFLEQTLLYGAYVGLSADTYAHTWRYVGQTFQRNPAFWILGFVGVVSLFAACRRRPRESGAWLLGGSSGDRTPPALALACWTTVIVLSILQHTAKFPYVFVNVAPAVAVCGAVALRRWGPSLWGRRAPRWRAVVAVTAAVVFLVLFPAAHHVRALGQELIRDQKAVMDRVDALTEPDDAVLDGVGMAVARPKATPYSMTARWHSERRAGASYPVIEHLLRTRPKVAIRNYRFRPLTVREKEFITSRFVTDWANLAVVGAVVRHEGPEPTDQVVDLLATTRYAIIAENPDRVSLEGRPVRPTVELSAGEYRLRVEGPPQTVIIQYARSVEVQPPPPRPPFQLYPSYSW